MHLVSYLYKENFITVGVKSPVAYCVDHITGMVTMVPGLSLSLSGTQFKLLSPQTFNDVLS